MNLVEVFGLLGTFGGALLGVLAALLLARWLLSTPRDSDTSTDHPGASGGDRRLTRILDAILRRSPH